MKMSADEPVSMERRDGVVRLAGALTLDNARGALASAEDVFDDGREPLVFDLGGLWRTDSAAIAVLLEWRRRAIRQERELEYRNAPERLRQLARISDLEAVVGFDTQD